MKHITKPSNPVDFNSGERRDLAEIIKGLRDDIIVSEKKSKSAPPDAGGKRPDGTRVEKNTILRRRVASAKRFRMGLPGIAERVPA